MSDHGHYGEYAEARHDHREYADERHDHDLDYAAKYHRHHDDESTAQGLREDLSRAEARIHDLEENLSEALEGTRALEDASTQLASVLRQLGERYVQVRLNAEDGTDRVIAAELASVVYKLAGALGSGRAQSEAPGVMCAACVQSAHTWRPDESGCQCSCHSGGLAAEVPT